MKSGFWGNYEREVWFEIDEHERWLRRSGNAERLGVPPQLIARFADLPDRDALLKRAWQSAPVMRCRCHGESATFEFNARNWHAPLALIEKWCNLFAGPYLHLRMVNFRTMQVRETLWKDFDNGIPDRR